MKTTRHSRLLVILAAALALTGVAWAAPALADPPDPATVVNVPDTTLRNCLTDALGLARGAALTAGATRNLTALDCSLETDQYGGVADGSQIASLAGLERFDFSSLTSLTLAGPGMTYETVQELGAMYAPALKALDLHEAHLTDIAPLGRLTSLEKLDLSKNQIADVRPLAHLSRLGAADDGELALNLDQNYVTDLSALGGLARLTAAEVSAVDQQGGMRGDIFLNLAPGTYDLNLADLDGSLPELTDMPEGAAVDLTAGTVTITDQVFYANWKNADETFTGSYMIAADPSFDYSDRPAPESFELIVDISIYRTTPYPDDWVTEDEIEAMVEVAEQQWEDILDVDLDFYVGDVARSTVTPEVCAASARNWGLDSDAAGRLGHTSQYYTWSMGHVLVVVYDANDCKLMNQWGGGTVPGAQNATVLGHGGIIYSDGVTNGVLAHELGHVFGLLHANRQTCPTAGDWADRWNEEPVAGTTCTTTEYGDSGDLMGRGGRMNIIELLHFGVVSEGRDLTVVDEPGTYTVTLDSADQPGGNRGILIVSPYQDERWRTEVYAVELRQAGWGQLAGVFVLKDSLSVSSRGTLAETILLQPRGVGVNDGDEKMAEGATWILDGGTIEVTLVTMDELHPVVRVTIHERSMTASPAGLSFAAGASQQTLTFDSPTAWIMTEYPSWLLPSQTTGPAGTTTLTLYADANIYQRTGELVFEQLAGTGVEPLTVQATQQASMSGVLQAFFARLKAFLRHLADSLG